MLYLKNWINKYFGFTKGEYNALLTLVFILLLLTVIPYFLTPIYAPVSSANPTEVLAIEQLTLAQKQQQRYVFNKQIYGQGSATNSSYFNFDPNTINLAQWQQLGFSVKQAQAILNYTSKGGRFYQPQDLQKMYTVSAQKYQALLPYIKIKSTAGYVQQNFTAPAAFTKKQPLRIEINTADTLALEQIKGIGPAFAKRIVKYRDRIGGFYKKEQLLEVYGLDSLKYNEMKEQISINPEAIVKININTAEFDALKNNPYLKYKQINAIIQYRKQHGKYSGIDDLKKVLILTPQNLVNLIPYLTF